MLLVLCCTLKKFLSHFMLSKLHLSCACVGRLEVLQFTLKQLQDQLAECTAGLEQESAGAAEFRSTYTLHTSWLQDHEVTSFGHLLKACFLGQGQWVNVLHCVCFPRLKFYSFVSKMAFNLLCMHFRSFFCLFALNCQIFVLALRVWSHLKNEL